MWFKLGGAGLKVLPSLPISLGFEDRVTFRRPVARAVYEFRLMAAKMSPNLLQELGVEDQLQLARCLRLRLGELDFEELAIGNQLEFARKCRQRLLDRRRCSQRGMGANETLPQPAVAEDSLDHIRLATFDEADDLHRAATFGTFQSLRTRLDHGGQTRVSPVD